MPVLPFTAGTCCDSGAGLSYRGLGSESCISCAPVLPPPQPLTACYTQIGCSGAILPLDLPSPEICCQSGGFSFTGPELENCISCLINPGPLVVCFGSDSSCSGIPNGTLPLSECCTSEAIDASYTVFGSETCSTCQQIPLPDTVTCYMENSDCTGQNRAVPRESCCDMGGLSYATNDDLSICASCSSTTTCGENELTCMEEGGHCYARSYRCDGIPDCLDVLGGEFGAPRIIDEEKCSPSGNCSHGEVRPLVGGSAANEGAIEVCFQGEFFPVYLSGLGLAEASVLCKQLNLSAAGFPVSAVEDLEIPRSYFRQQQEGIVLAQIDCNGTEQRVIDCSQLSQVFLFEVSQEAFAGIRCIEPVECSDGDMRLVNGSQTSQTVRSGRLEICSQGVWGAVFDTNWTAVDAAVTCKQMGFSPKGALPLTAAVFSSDPVFLPIVYDSPACESISNTSLLDCPRLIRGRNLDSGSVLGNSQLFSLSGALTSLVGVSCEDYPDFGCSDNDVRLTYRQTRAVGNVEICKNNVWLGVCNDFLRQGGINVACRFLGFNEFEESQFIHESIQPIINNSVSIFEEFLDCVGSEPNFTFCPPPISFTNVFCDPSQVVRIRCQARPEVLFSPLLVSDVLVVEEGRPASVDCVLSTEFTYPPVEGIFSDVSVIQATPPPLTLPPLRNRRQVLSTQQSRNIFSTVHASQSDSGTYNCTVVTGRPIRNSSDNVIEVLPGSVPSTRTLTVRVQGEYWIECARAMQFRGISIS